MGEQQTADYSLYDTLCETWWDENSLLNLLKTTVNPWRVPYFARLITENIQHTSTPSLLDVGCGGALLTEEFARLKCKVTGMDPSHPTINTARQHAAESGLDITYIHGFGNGIPFQENSFDLVSCCDVLEHIDNWQDTIEEIARVLKPGGLFLFDTINRTAYSWLVNIFIAQDFPLTRFMPRQMHVWPMFIKPHELTRCLSNNQLETRQIVGASPKGSPLQALSAIRKFKRGIISAEAVGEVASMRPSKNTRGSYMGYAQKQA